MDKFGYTTNDKGYKVLPAHIRVIQGDGINEDSIAQILENARRRGLAAENFVFGMGGAMLQKVDRDTLKFAMKANAICIDGEWKDVYKDPIHGGKKSKRGRQIIYKDDDGNYVTIKMSPQNVGLVDTQRENELEIYYQNGVQTKVTNLKEIRERASA